MEEKQWWFRISDSISVALLAVLSIFIQFLTEWLFFITKPSFLHNLPISQAILVLFSSPFLPVCIALVLIFCISAVSATLKNQRYRSFLEILSRLIPAFFFSTTIYLLIDNFSSVILKKGIRTSHSGSRILYLLIFVGIIVVAFKVTTKLDLKWKTQKKPVSFILVILLLLFTTEAIKARPQQPVIPPITGSPKSGNRPNILLFGADSVEALSTSAYGYEKDTTPFLRTFAKSGLLCENAFANASQTAGSLTSLLTGKLPTSTRVLHEPDFLTDADSYEHLPYLLKKMGYRSAQFSVRIYGDAFDLNLRSSFDLVNFRNSRAQNRFERLAGITGQTSVSFVRQTYQRISERLLHVFFIRKMDEPFSVVTDANVAWASDQQNLKGLLEFIESTRQPFFAHIHLLNAHLETPAVRTLHFNTRYESTIKEIDRKFKLVVDSLERSNSLRNTLIIFYSDHALRGGVRKKIPLIFWFPNSKPSGTVRHNVSLLDVSPTIVNYLGLPMPAWMQGRSILSDRIKRCRKIITADAGPWRGDYVVSKPPFFSLWKLTFIVCDRFYYLDLVNNQYLEGSIQGHTGECTWCGKIPAAEAKKFIIQHLKQNGYDTSSLEAKTAALLNNRKDQS